MTMWFDERYAELKDDDADAVQVIFGDYTTKCYVPGERVVALETLVRDMWFKNIGRMDSCGWCVMGCDDDEKCDFQERMRELGIEGLR